MTRQRFVFLFVVLALCFVPIVISLGLIGWVVPAGWGIASALMTLVKWKWRQALVFAVYSAAYVVAFYLVARLVYWLIALTRHRKVIWGLQIAVLVALFGCSFLRVITYGSIQGRGGTYTFWTAVVRAIERSSR